MTVRGRSSPGTSLRIALRRSPIATAPSLAAPSPIRSSARPTTGASRPQSSAAGPRAVHARRERDAATDDAALLEAAGFVVKIVESTPANVKITTPADLPLAAALLAWELEADI
jgi:hypothetical protein